MEMRHRQFLMECVCHGISAETPTEQKTLLFTLKRCLCVSVYETYLSARNTKSKHL